MQLARQTVAPCSADGYNVSASVVDRSGVLLAMVRAGGAGPHTAEASRAKAFTSASSRNPTSGIAKAIQSNPDAAGMANIPGFLVLGGGVPLKTGNETIGAISAIGVAGAPGGHLDEACAHKAITALKDQLQQCRRHAAEKGLGSSLRAARPAKQAAAERSRQRVAPTFSRPVTSVPDLARTDSEDPVAISHIGSRRHPDQTEDGHDSCHGCSFTSSIKSGLNAYR